MLFFFPSLSLSLLKTFYLQCSFFIVKKRFTFNAVQSSTVQFSVVLFSPKKHFTFSTVQLFLIVKERFTFGAVFSLLRNALPSMKFLSLSLSLSVLRNTLSSMQFNLYLRAKKHLTFSTVHLFLTVKKCFTFGAVFSLLGNA